MSWFSKIYCLYHDKENNSIIISRKNRNHFIPKKLDDKELYYYNDCYFLSKCRKTLKEKGNEMLNLWIKETETKLQILKEIKI